MNVPTPAPAVNKRLSRSNSTSSSVSTVKYIGSKIGHRSSLSTTRPTSSDSINHHFSILDAATEKSNVEKLHNPGRTNRSPNRNINRWSHSTSSSMGVVEKDVLRQVPPNSIAARAAKFESPMKPAINLKSQYSIRQPTEQSIAGLPQQRSPTKRPRSSQKNSPEQFKGQEVVDRFSPRAATPDVDASASRAPSSEYFATTVLDHSKGANKFGQPIESIALQFNANQPRQRRPDQNKLGNGLLDATNSSHISLQKKPGHARRREQSEHDSREPAPGGSVSSLRNEHSKKISHRSPVQKNMLAQALAKANQAVLLDNAQDISGAIHAYVEACDILEQVMVRSSDNEDRKKLSAIRNTYSSRIADLYDIDKSFEHLNKELPEAPATTHYLQGQDRVSFEDPIDLQPRILIDGEDDDEPQRSTHIPLRQESLLPQIFGGEQYIERQPPPSRNKVPPLTGLNVPMDSKYMPPPLSPRRPITIAMPEEQLTTAATLHPNQAQHHGHNHRLSSGSTSWLDTVDDNNSSIPSSRLSSIDYGTQDQENDLASAIDAEFDAMSAFVDEAYEEEPHTDATPRPSEAHVYEEHQEHELNQPRVENQHFLSAQPSQDSMMSDAEFDYMRRDYYEEDADAAEEEELLDMMMADGYAFDGQKQRAGTMSSLPRQSDSSGFSARSSGRTWESSLTTATNGTALSTLAESPEIPHQESKEVVEDADGDTLSTHEPETMENEQTAHLYSPSVAGMDKLPLRDRRMSGQSAKQLKIETFTRRPSVSQQGQPTQAPLLEAPQIHPEPQEVTQSTLGPDLSLSTLPLTPLALMHSTESTESPGTPALGQVFSNSTFDEEFSNEPRMAHVRKKTSSSNIRPHNLSVTTNDLNELPSTPGSALYTSLSRQGTSIITPAVSSVSPNVLSSTSVGGLYIFDHIADPMSPMGHRSHDSMRNEPLPLELCPESPLLRPFWLMRCLYQTMAHPKGGYMSTKLFVPRDIWRVKGVKIKGIEDKIGQCDVLTAALLKLAKVDTLDAAACCEELHSFEAIIENTKLQLQKKLGGDVGITGSMAAMRSSPAEDPEVSSTKTSSSMKSWTNSLRKLRSKSSNTVLTPTINLNVRRDYGNDISMPSVPMTASSAVKTSRSYRNQRYPPPTPTGLPFIPPQHANYMSSLARLFDAVQVLDSIARQVEDPGLKATSQSHVGLDLSIRGAAEFFSFYILRFVLADIGMLIDKYLKRNAEWVMT